MYKVVIRKSLRCADGSSAQEESQEEVNHERHALNLAAKIARSDAVESVEIEESGGQFKAQANRVSRGKVQATLQSPRRRVQREIYFHSGLTNRVGKLLLLSLLGLGTLGYMISHAVRSPGSRENSSASGSRLLQIADFQVRAIALVSPSAELMRLRGISLRSGYQPLMVNINVSNVGQFTNCLEFDALLVVRSGNKPQMPGIRALSEPKAYNLRPAENRDGSYTFEVKRGVEPLILELVPKSAREYTCQYGKKSGARPLLVKKLDLSLEELPKPSQD